ncbi:uncharacterized protein METZ01_LOCUS87841, partial [marine metagenome]
MPIKYQILTLGIVGNLLIAGIMYFGSDFREGRQSEVSSESLAELYETAWFVSSEASYLEHISKWNPDTFVGDFVDFWNPDVNLFPDEADEKTGVALARVLRRRSGHSRTDAGVYTNPLFDAILSNRLDDAQFLFEYLFKGDLESKNLSFVMVYTPLGQQVYCGSSGGYGVDACGRDAVAAFTDGLTSFINSTNKPTRGIIRIDDQSGRSRFTLNQSLRFSLKDNNGDIIAAVVVGRNLFENLVLFEDKYSIRAGVYTSGESISIEDYGVEDAGGGRFGINNIDSMMARARTLKTSRGDRFSVPEKELGASITVFPVSNLPGAADASLVVLKDEKASYQQLSEYELYTYIVIVIAFILISILLLSVMSKAFGGITRAISVLQGLTKGELDEALPARTGVLVSDKDEVGQLANALESYRAQLRALEDLRSAQAGRRRQRDAVIIEKMSVLADQLEGRAKELMLADIQNMQAGTESDSDQDGETASIEMMSLAFSRMSDEVNSLIEARTEELEVARNEADEANLAKSRFFANMSHELRTPLTAIIGYGEMIAEDCEDLGYDDLLPDVKKITTSGKYLLELINSVLDLQKIEAGKMELYMTSFSIEAMLVALRDINTPLAEKNANQFLIEYENGLGTMFQDETKVSQCLTNFLSNAFKFTNEGTVTLAIEPFDENGADMIRFNVQDTGVGMTPEQLTTVFEEYQQGERSTRAETAQRGTGLGLSLTKSYAELMGGRVEAESEKGVGSTFGFIIPREFSNEDTGETLDPIVRNLDDQSIVVLIDDDPVMHDVVKRTLSKSGVTMVGATNGERGLEIVRESKPKLILLDVYMSGRDGWSILREVKSDPDLKDIPVVMVTQLSEERFAKSLGADGYFTKPIDRKRFVEEISRILSAASRSEQVLVIDDDENTRTLLSRILAEEGWQSIVANDGIDGLEKINELGAKDEKPSLIVLDIDMPRMDGFEFLEVYSRDIPVERRSPVLIFSGKDLSTMQRDLLAQYENVKGVQSKEDVPGLTALIKEIQQEATASS